MSHPMVEVRDLRVTFRSEEGPIYAVDGVDLDLAPGETLALLATPPAPDLPPLVSGMVGYLAYDVVRRLEVLPDDNVDDLGLPERERTKDQVTVDSAEATRGEHVDAGPARQRRASFDSRRLARSSRICSSVIGRPSSCASILPAARLPAVMPSR